VVVSCDDSLQHIDIGAARRNQAPFNEGSTLTSGWKINVRMSLWILGKGSWSMLAQSFLF
jgi:hypothetical protein